MMTLTEGWRGKD